MASKRGTAILIEQAETRVNHLLPALATFLGIAVDPIPTNHRDPLLERVQRAEWLANTLETIDHAVVSLADAVKLKAEVDRLTAELEAAPGRVAAELNADVDRLTAELEAANAKLAALVAAAALATEALVGAAAPATEGVSNDAGVDQEPATNPSPEGGEGTPDREVPEGATVLDAQYDQEQYRDLKLDQLKAIAVLAGATDDDVAKLRAKADVLEVISARAAAPDFEPVMFTIGDEGEVEAFEMPSDLESGADETGPGPDNSTTDEDQ